MPCLLWTCADSQDDAPPEKAEAVAVEVAEVKAEIFKEEYRGIGTLEAEETIAIKPELSGVVRKIHFEEGAFVKAGSLLFTLDSSELVNQLQEREKALEAARARLKDALQSYRRLETLFERKVISKDRWDEVNAELDVAQAEVDRLEAAVAVVQGQVDDTSIRAPSDGVLSQKNIDEGVFVDVGQELVTLYSIESIETSFKVPDRYMGRIREGQPMAITVGAYPDRVFHGRISFVSPKVDEQTRDFPVKGVVDNTDRLLKPGAFATVVVTLEVYRDQPSVPEEALVPTRSGYMVFVVENGKVEERQVRLGLRRVGAVQVLEGVKPGEIVVREGHMRLTEGVRIQVVGDGHQPSETE